MLHRTMPTHDFEMELTTAESGGPIKNLFPLYLHDVAAYERKPPNRHGVYHDTDDIETLAQQCELNGPWWRTPEHLFPYLARVGGVPAGFNLIASGPYVPTDGVDFVVYEFFVVHAFRGDGTAERLAREGIARHRGSWEVVTYPGAELPIAFWRRILPLCATGDVVETKEDHPFGHKIVWRFRNGEPSG